MWEDYQIGGVYKKKINKINLKQEDVKGSLKAEVHAWDPLEEGQPRKATSVPNALWFCEWRESCQAFVHQIQGMGAQIKWVTIPRCHSL